MIPRVVFLFHLLSPLFHPNLFIQPISAFHPYIPGLIPFYKDSLFPRDSTNKVSLESKISHELKTFFYDQTLDHFNYGPLSYGTFKQKYVVDFTHWGGASSSSPIFAYLGAERPLDGIWDSIGFLKENAKKFNALSIYIEHRFYGQSIPFGSMETAFKNETVRGYFNSAQALADYAEVLLHVKKMFSSPNSPIIVIGGSYGGMLASWFRLKYPHIALGALASSAPVLYFDNITPQSGYVSVVTKDFKDVSESCYETIQKSWYIIDKIASKPNGLQILSRKFRTCSPLKSSDELKGYLKGIYAVAAQYDSPPDYPVTILCNGIDRSLEKTDILARIFAGLVSFSGNETCYINSYNAGHSHQSDTALGWQWQTCTELMSPIGTGENNASMFQPARFNLKGFVETCKRKYGVSPRPHWITTYYGGHDIKLVLERFGSNIIFSNGLRDPYSSGGVLEDISETVLAVTTVNGSHSLDLQISAKTDPDWLIMQRNTEVKIIEGWIKKYYADLKALMGK